MALFAKDDTVCSAPSRQYTKSSRPDPIGLYAHIPIAGMMRAPIGQLAWLSARGIGAYLKT